MNKVNVDNEKKSYVEGKQANVWDSPLAGPGWRPF